MKLKVLESTKPIVEKSKNVAIDRSKIKKFAREVKKSDLRIELSESSFGWPQNKLIDLILIFNTINFFYWAGKGEEKWSIKLKDKFLDGSAGVFAALEKAIEEGYELFRGKALVDLSKADFKHIMRGNIEIPMLEKRVACLNEAGGVLERRFKGEFVNLVREANRSAVKLTYLLVNNFPSFDDSAKWREVKVEFHKRAQLSAKMIHDALHGKGLGKFDDLDKLTVFADYKLPQMLRKAEILSYAKSLANKIDNFVEIPAGSQEEIEIRANTIWACEFIKEELKPRFPSVIAAYIDSLLWLASQKKSPADKPYHRTRTIFY